MFMKNIVSSLWVIGSTGKSFTDVKLVFRRHN